MSTLDLAQEKLPLKNVSYFKVIGIKKDSYMGIRYGMAKRLLEVNVALFKITHLRP